MLSSLGNIKNDNARAQHRFLKTAENLYLNAIHRAGYKYVNGRIVEDEEKGQNEDSKEGESIDFARKKRYNKLSFKFQHQNFPPENEVWSEAHRLAVWWATKSDTETGDQTLISLKDNWYLVEKFDNAENNYQVEELISKADFEFIFKEYKANGKIGKIKSILSTTDGYVSNDRQYNAVQTGKSSTDNSQTQYRGKGAEMVRLDSNQIEGRERVAGDGNGDSQGGGENRQGSDAVKRLSKKKHNNLWNFLTNSEQFELYERIAGLKLLNNSEKRMANGNFLLDINNLMVETNGDFDNPSIESIIEFDYFTDCITEARIYFYENVNNGNRIQDSVEIVND